MIRVCMLVYGYWPAAGGGAERQARLLSNALAQCDAKVTVITARLHHHLAIRELDGPTEVVRCATLSSLLGACRLMPKRSKPMVEVAGLAMSRKTSTARPSVLAALVRELNKLVFLICVTSFLARKRNHFDVLHVHTTTWLAGFAGWIGARLSWPVVAKESSYPGLCEWSRRPTRRAWWYFLMGNVHFVATHQAMADDLIRQGVVAKRIAVIPNGVILPPEMAPVGINSLVLYVGNLSQGVDDKGLDVLLKAVALARVRHPELHVVLAGGGDPSAVQLLAEETGAAPALTLAGRIEDVGALYRQAAVLLLPSRREGMSNALLEAQSWGIPAIASDIPGNRAVIEHDENGLLVPVGDADATVTALVALLTGDDRRIRLGAAARARAEKGYAIDSVAEKTMALYARIISGQTASA